MVDLHAYIARKRNEALALIARRAAKRAEYNAASRPPPPPDIHKAAKRGAALGARFAKLTMRSAVR